MREALGAARALSPWRSSAVLAIAGLVLTLIDPTGSFAVPGSAGAPRSALLASVLVGGGAALSIASSTPWWAWGAARSPRAVRVPALAVYLGVIVGAGGVVRVLSGFSPWPGWLVVSGVLVVATIVMRRAVASTAVVGVALVVLAITLPRPSGVFGVAHPASWVDPRGTTPYVLALGAALWCVAAWASGRQRSIRP